MPGRVNYDAIASTYNLRFAEKRRSGTLLALEGLLQVSGAERVLEVGCGTGHWLEGLCSPARRAVDLDFSAGMLAQTHHRENAVDFVQGRAEELPFPAGSFDLVYCVNAIHHFQRQSDFIGRARRVLRLGGALAVLDDPFLAKNACSQLALLSDQAYAVGLGRIRQALAEAEAQGKTLIFQNTIRIHQLTGWVKGNAAILD
jgi:ubiquinone/menaquinone biosynthesis C-methylase UbiE